MYKIENDGYYSIYSTLAEHSIICKKFNKRLKDVKRFKKCKKICYLSKTKKYCGYLDYKIYNNNQTINQEVTSLK